MTRKFDVVTTMTEEEYQSWSSGREVKLQMRTKWSDEPYTEDDVPRIVADAAAAIGILPGSFQPRKCNAREWPFGLKTAVMSAAYRNWAPGCETSNAPPEWFGDKRDAEYLFDEEPELRTALFDWTKASQDYAAGTGDTPATPEA